MQVLKTTLFNAKWWFFKKKTDFKLHIEFLYYPCKQCMGKVDFAFQDFGGSIVPKTSTSGKYHIILKTANSVAIRWLDYQIYFEIGKAKNVVSNIQYV